LAYRDLVRLPAALVAAVLSLTACAGSPGDGEPLDVVVGLYPYAYLLERIGGDDVRVESLAVQGVEPHDLELSPRQAAAVADADLVVLSRGFSPALDDAAGQSAADRSLDVLDLVDVLPYRDAGAGAPLDPHVWLDPVRLARISDGLAERLAELERQLWLIVTGRAAARTDPALRRTYGFFDAAERLGERGLGRVA